MNTLCTAYAYLFIHIHHKVDKMIEKLIFEFSPNIDLNIALLLILKYLASDCDNESIVVDDSIRKSFFKYLDMVSPIIFDQVFNLWSSKINTF